MIPALCLTQILLISFLVTHALTLSNIQIKLTKNTKNASTKVIGATTIVDSPRNSPSKKGNGNKIPSPSSITTFHNKKVSFANILTDSCPTGVKLFAEVINYEDSAAAYTVHLTDCSDNIPVDNIELEPAIEAKLPRISNYTARMSHVFLIPPRRSQIFTIDLLFQNSTKIFEGRGTCLINILNRLNGKLGRKLINFSPGDACICSTNCACSCHRDDDKLICNQISDETLVLDWLRRSVTPTIITTDTSHTSNSNKNQDENSNGGNKKKAKTKTPTFDTSGSDSEAIARSDESSSGLTGTGTGTRTEGKGWMANANEKFQSLKTISIQSLNDMHLFYLSLLLVSLVLLILLLLGTCKGLCGICSYAVGRCGLSHFYDEPRILDKYYERKYSKYSVIHDSEGYPLDPFTRGRTVKRLNPCSAFFLNVFYFLCFPVFCLYGVRDQCCNKTDSKSKYNVNQTQTDGTEITATAYESRGRILSNSFNNNNSPDRSAISLKPSTGDHDIHNQLSQNVRVALQGSSSTEMEMNEFNFNEEEDEEEKIPNQNNQNGYNQYYTAGYVQIFPDDTNFPLPTSSTILNKLTREPQEWPIKSNDPNNNNYSNINNCCRPGLPYGSWHRAPAIFNDEYEGESLFDLQRTLLSSRRSHLNQEEPTFKNETPALFATKSEEWH